MGYLACGWNPQKNPTGDTMSRIILIIIILVVSIKVGFSLSEYVGELANHQQNRIEAVAGHF